MLWFVWGSKHNGAEPRIFVSEAPSGDWANHPLVAPDDRALNTYLGSPMESVAMRLQSHS